MGVDARGQWAQVVSVSTDQAPAGAPPLRLGLLYVTEEGRFSGAISLHDIKSYLNAPELAEVIIAGDISRDDTPTIRPSATLNEALDRFAQHFGERLPVVTDDGTRWLIGSLAKTDVILALAGSGRRGARLAEETA